MPTISFDTIEHSDVTGLEVTHHEYVIRENGKEVFVAHFKDFILCNMYFAKEAKDLINSLIHEKTKSPNKTKGKNRTELPNARPSDKRQGYLVGGDYGTKEGGVVENAMSGIDLTDQLRCFE